MFAFALVAAVVVGSEIKFHEEFKPLYLHQHLPPAVAEKWGIARPDRPMGFTEWRKFADESTARASKAQARWLKNNNGVLSGDFPASHLCRIDGTRWVRIWEGEQWGSRWHWELWKISRIKRAERNGQVIETDFDVLFDDYWPAYRTGGRDAFEKQ